MTAPLPMRSSSSAPPATSPTRRSSRRCRRWPGAGTSTCRSSASRKSGWTLEQLASARARQPRREHGGGVDEAAFAKLIGAAALRRRRLQRRRDLRRAARGARRRHAARRTTWRFRRACSPTVVDGARRSRAAPEDARVIVEKPFGRDLASARALNETLHQRLRRVGDLPHRPLPRQGGGAEPPLLPLRQHVPRADLEPQLRRERADHHGRELRRAGARAVLRGGRRDPRRHPEPPAAGGRLPRHGAAARRRTPSRSATSR